MLKENTLNKAGLIDELAQKTGIPRNQVEQLLDTFEAIVIERLKNGGEVTLTGFGTFMAKYRHARGGVNPRKPEERIQIPAVTVPKFKAGKTLKDALKS